MYLLAFETSCDDTSIAVFLDNQLLAMATRRQIAEHQATQGVVPEVAARIHANVIFEVLEDVLKEADISSEQIDAIACTDHPGLLPSLLVGMTVAKTLGAILHKPVRFVDHITSHMFANLLERDKNELVFPNICLTVSGGHNELYFWKSLHEKERIGQTLDDSAGEAFDKVAKMLSLGFPGGPHISRLAAEYAGENKNIFPRVLLKKEEHNFSFSGLKSAVKREIDERKKSLGIAETENLPYAQAVEIAFEFEQAVIDILTTKLFWAADAYNTSCVVLAGGVSANTLLKARIWEKAKKAGKLFFHPIKPVYSQDNAAMVGAYAYELLIADL